GNSRKGKGAKAKSERRTQSARRRMWAAYSRRHAVAVQSPPTYHGRITKAGCPQTRAMLVQAVQAASDHPGPIGAFFRRLRKRKKYNVAVIATARKLVTIAYLMLKNNEPYRYAKPLVVKN